MAVGGVDELGTDNTAEAARGCVAALSPAGGAFSSNDSIFKNSLEGLGEMNFLKLQSAGPEADIYPGLEIRSPG